MPGAPSLELPDLPHGVWPHHFRYYFFILPNAPPNHPKPTQRHPKGCPLDVIFGHFGAPGGNVKTMVSCTRNHRFHGWRRSPETPEASKKLIQKRIQKKYRKNTKNTENCFPKGPQGEAKRRSTNQHFRHFFDLAPLGVPWGAPGSPKDPNGPQNTSKMTPKSLLRVLK